MRGEWCPFAKADDSSSVICEEDCALYYYESEGEQGCSIERIAYYLNWIGTLIKEGQANEREDSSKRRG